MYYFCLPPLPRLDPAPRRLGVVVLDTSEAVDVGLGGLDDLGLAGW